MTCHHAMLADIYAMLEAELVGHLSLGTFAKTHVAGYVCFFGQVLGNGTQIYKTEFYLSARLLVDCGDDEKSSTHHTNTHSDNYVDDDVHH